MERKEKICTKTLFVFKNNKELVVFEDEYNDSEDRNDSLILKKNGSIVYIINCEELIYCKVFFKE